MESFTGHYCRMNIELIGFCIHVNNLSELQFLTWVSFISRERERERESCLDTKTHLHHNKDLYNSRLILWFLNYRKDIQDLYLKSKWDYVQFIDTCYDIEGKYWGSCYMLVGFITFAMLYMYINVSYTKVCGFTIMKITSIEN